MNYRSIDLCQQFLDRWKEDIEQDRPIDGGDTLPKED